MTDDRSERLRKRRKRSTRGANRSEQASDRQDEPNRAAETDESQPDQNPAREMGESNSEQKSAREMGESNSEQKSAREMGESNSEQKSAKEVDESHPEHDATRDAGEGDLERLETSDSDDPASTESRLGTQSGEESADGQGDFGSSGPTVTSATPATSSEVPASEHVAGTGATASDIGGSTGSEIAPTPSADAADDEDADEQTGSVKEERTGTYMYLPDGQLKDLKRLYNVLKAEYEFEFDEKFEKNRHFYPLVIRHGLEGLDEMAIGEVRESLQGD